MRGIFFVRLTLCLSLAGACSIGPAPPIPSVPALPPVAPATATGTPARPTATPEPTQTAIPTPTTWPMSPIVLALGWDLADFYRIENGFLCGNDGDAMDCMLLEPDPLVMARVAIGEAPDSVNDQLFVLWLIRMRAELGFKNNKYSHGWCENINDWCYIPGRWGEPTTIKQEALCIGGCQFSPVRVAQRVYYPCLLSGTDPIRKMLCPTDNQLGDFDVAYRAAVHVLEAPLEDFPAELRGYDNFRSPEITGEGQFNRIGGLRSRQFWIGGNIWRDEFVDDNLFWWPPVLTPTPTDARLVP